MRIREAAPSLGVYPGPGAGGGRPTISRTGTFSSSAFPVGPPNLASCYNCQCRRSRPRPRAALLQRWTGADL